MSQAESWRVFHIHQIQRSKRGLASRQQDKSTWSRENQIDVSIAEFSPKHKWCHNLPYIPISNDMGGPEKHGQTFNNNINSSSNHLKCATFSSEKAHHITIVGIFFNKVPRESYLIREIFNNFKESLEMSGTTAMKRRDKISLNFYSS